MPFLFFLPLSVSSLTGWDRLLRNSKSAESLGRGTEGCWPTPRHSFWFIWYLFIFMLLYKISISMWLFPPSVKWFEVSVGLFIRILNHLYTKDKERKLGRCYKVKAIQVSVIWSYLSSNTHSCLLVSIYNWPPLLRCLPRVPFSHIENYHCRKGCCTETPSTVNCVPRGRSAPPSTPLLKDRQTWELENYHLNCLGFTFSSLLM